ncbi:MAG: hypothetical protein ABSC73_09215 [Acidimicrobiales bacterium]
MVTTDKTENELFRSAVLKTVWAVDKTHRFEAELQTALDHVQTDPPFTTRQEYHPEFRGFSIKIATIRSVPPLWGLTLGDIVNTFHSAFDNLAWALVYRGKTPPAKLSEAQQRGGGRGVPGTRPGNRRKTRGEVPVESALIAANNAGCAVSD